MYNNENNQGFGPFENGNNGGYPYGGQNGPGQPEVNLNGQPWQNPNRQPGAGSDVPPQNYNSQASGPYYTGQGAAGAGRLWLSPALPGRRAAQHALWPGLRRRIRFPEKQRAGYRLPCIGYPRLSQRHIFCGNPRWMYWRSSWASSLSSKTIRKKGFLLQG